MLVIIDIVKVKIVKIVRVTIDYATPKLGALRKKCPYSVLFWSAFFQHSDRIRRDSPYLSVFSSNAGKFGKNADQNNSEHEDFLHSEGNS